MRLQNKGLIMQMDVCFVEGINTNQIMSSTGFVHVDFESEYKILVKNITLHLEGLCSFHK